MSCEIKVLTVWLFLFKMIRNYQGMPQFDSTVIQHSTRSFSAFPGHLVLFRWDKYWNGRSEMIKKCPILTPDILERSTVIRHAHFWIFFIPSCSVEIYVWINENNVLISILQFFKRQNSQKTTRTALAVCSILIAFL